MKINKKKLFINVLLLIILIFTPFSTYAAENTENNNEENILNLYSKSCILVETTTGTVAYEKNSTEKMYPASTTKLLTAILAIENCNLTDTVTITNEMISKVPAGYTTAYLRPGEIITVEQLLNILLILSANDAGFALAIHISGSVENFANLMNEKAKEIGCVNTHFTNPSGIQDENHYSTAKDMSLIGTYAIKYPLICEIGAQTSYTLSTQNGTTRTFETTNTLIKNSEPNYYEYANGLKTGYTADAGSCVIATAQKDNMKFLAVVLDAPKPENNIVYRDIDCKTLFEYGFTNYDKFIKITDKYFTIFKNTVISNGKISKIFNISLVLFTCLLLITIITKKSGKKKKKSKASVKEKNKNIFNNIIEKKDSPEEFHFRCSFW